MLTYKLQLRCFGKLIFYTTHLHSVYQVCGLCCKFQWRDNISLVSASWSFMTLLEMPLAFSQHSASSYHIETGCGMVPSKRTLQMIFECNDSDSHSNLLGLKYYMIYSSAIFLICVSKWTAL